MKKILILAIFLTILLLVNHHPIFAADCNNPPSGFGGDWARAYRQWCESCCGTYSSSGSSCNPGPNWGCGSSSGSGSPSYTPPSYDYEAERQRQEEAERQRRAEIEENARKEAEEAKQRQVEFEQKKDEALKSMKGITENELGLKGISADNGLGLKGVGADSGLGLKGVEETRSGGLGLKTLFEKPDGPAPAVDSRVKGSSKLDVGKNINFSAVNVQDGVPDAVQLKKDLLDNFSGSILKRTEQPNEQAQEILKSFKMVEPLSPIKNIDNLAPGDVVLVAPTPKGAPLKDALVSNGINLLDKWGSDNWTSPASHAAIFLGERNGKRWYLDNTSEHGPVIKEEVEFLKEYGARKMDVATLVGQPLSSHEGEELWKGAHEMRNTKTYGPSGFLNLGNDAMVCSETSRWALVRAGRVVPETQSGNIKIFGLDTGLNKKQFVKFSPSDFYKDQQYFVVHQLSIQGKEEKKP